MARYIFTGGASFVFEYGVFLLLVYVIVYPVWAGQIVSYASALIVNYLLLKKWTFVKVGNKSEQRRTFVKYLLLVMVNMPLTTGLVVFLESVGTEAFIAKLIVVALAACWNFIVYDKLIFRHKTSIE